MQSSLVPALAPALLLVASGCGKPAVSAAAGASESPPAAAAIATEKRPTAAPAQRTWSSWQLARQRPRPFSGPSSHCSNSGCTTPSPQRSSYWQEGPHSR
jgi:hypothetical protein